MIARLYIVLPFRFLVPTGNIFAAYHYEEDGYLVMHYPPMRSQELAKAPSPEILVDGREAIVADVLQIDFKKTELDRTSGNQCDPPFSLLERSVNSFLTVLRFVTRAGQIRPVNFIQEHWRVHYLNDDGSELEEEEGLVRSRGTLTFSISYAVVDEYIWDQLHRLPSDYQPPPWDGILLDAFDALPDIGPAIVLAATSLEVFISSILDLLAEKNKIPIELWTWLNGRDPLKQPSTEEQFDQLLRLIGGASLKTDARLWERFKNLKGARNSFVHDGVARIGKTSDALTLNQARDLVMAAPDIVRFVRNLVPEELRWPEFDHKIELSWTQELIPGSSGDGTTGGP